MARRGGGDELGAWTHDAVARASDVVGRLAGGRGTGARETGVVFLLGALALAAVVASTGCVQVAAIVLATASGGGGGGGPPPPPSLVLAPATGPTTGGTEVVARLAGGGFDPALVAEVTVLAGGTSDAAVTTDTVVTPGEVRFRMPPAPGGNVPGRWVVQVRNGALRTSSTFWYESVAPALTAVSPGIGPDTGGTALTIEGTGFTLGSTVLVGGVYADARFESATRISATTAATTSAGVALAVTVTVSNADGKTGELAGAFSYLSTRFDVSLSPGSGPCSGGTTVTATVTTPLMRLDPGAPVSVTVGGASASGSTVVSPTEVRFTTPRSLRGTYPGAVQVIQGVWRSTNAAYAYQQDLSWATQPPPAPPRPAGNLPPVIATTAGPLVRALAGEEVRFQLTVTEPDGEALSLRASQLPPGCLMEPAAATTSPVTRTVRWRVPSFAPGLQRIELQASDGWAPPARLTVAVQVTGATTQGPTVVVGDLTGDGLADTVATEGASAGSSSSPGTLYLWSGAAAPAGPPAATLRAQGTGEGFGDALSGAGLQLADVTGDGALDLVVASPRADPLGVLDAGAIYVWAGSPGMTAGVVAPTATLGVPGAATSARLGDSLTGQPVLLEDVTGDGVLDVVTGTRAGWVYVWAGGASLVGTISPRASLDCGGVRSVDYLATGGGGRAAQWFLAGDVTADGTLDIVAGTPDAAWASARAGRVLVWAGGGTLSGAASPAATLTVPGAATDDFLGLCAGQGLLLEDVTGDGTPDVVAAAAFADIAGTGNCGAVYLWAGGAGLSGALDPTATLAVPGASSGDALGSAAGQGLVLGDVTGDGVPDVVAGTPYAVVAGIRNAGAVYLWEGGAGLTGAVAPRASLEAGSSGLTSCAAGRGLHLIDVTADGLADIVALAEGRAVFVWPGGAGLSGAVGPGAGLALPARSWPATFLQFADVTGDGDPDLLATLPEEVTVWAGGPGLSGGVAPLARLQRLDQRSRPVQAADVTGDGVLDVVASAPAAGGGKGAIYVWVGGAALGGTPTATWTLVDPAGARAVSGSGLGEHFDEHAGDWLGGGGGGQTVQLADVSGDGTLDVVASTPLAARFGVQDAGVVHLWLGGAGLASAPTVLAHRGAPDDILGATPRATDIYYYAYFYFPVAARQGVHLADVTGDGVPDVLAATPSGDTDGVADAGAVYLWAGAWGLEEHPTARFVVPGAPAGLRLGGP